MKKENRTAVFGGRSPLEERETKVVGTSGINLQIAENDALERGVVQQLLLKSVGDEQDKEDDQECDGSEEAPEESGRPANSIVEAYRLLTPSVKGTHNRGLLSTEASTIARMIAHTLKLELDEYRQCMPRRHCLSMTSCGLRKQCVWLDDVHGIQSRQGRLECWQGGLDKQRATDRRMALIRHACKLWDDSAR
ncbi:hypothetical protein HAX54_035742 [Datura stramonium]|uniref:Uncharacterized protein n=1 Tax=Datura stramonium TaxID=4076 RepID=A0ABS8SFX9_DATST|nr:hypothetical protein [Datura stramonium]